MKIFLQIIFTLLFVFLSIFFLYTKGVDNTFFKIDFYEELMSSTDVSNLLIDGILSSFEEPEDSQEIRRSKEEVRIILEESFTKEWLDAAFLYLVGDVLAYTRGDKDDVTAVLDITHQKQALEQVLESDDDDDDGSFFTEIPDEIILKNILEDNHLLSKIDIFRAYYDFYKIAIFSALIALFSIVMVLAKPLNGMKWNGLAMTSSSLFVILSLLISKNIIQQLAVNFSNMSLDVDNISKLSNIFFSRFYPSAYLFLAIGILLFMASIIIEKKKNKI